MYDIAMDNITVEKLTQLIKDAADALHEYETSVLKGVHDEDWPTWYANWILDKINQK